ncbi:MAG: hypothetical protein ABIP44_07195 [Pseudoxanthomonas sp.]
MAAQRLSSQFDALVKRASTDSAFAFALAKALHTCTEADGKYRALSKQTSELGARAEETLAKYDREYAMCAGLSKEQLEQQYGLMEQAARQGVLDAQLAYSELVNTALDNGYATRTPGATDRFRTNVDQFLDAAARSGDLDGMIRAYMFQSTGILAPRNPVRAYGYLYAYDRAVAGDAARASLSMQNLLRSWRQLTPEQQRQVPPP